MIPWTGLNLMCITTIHRSFQERFFCQLCVHRNPRVTAVQARDQNEEVRWVPVSERTVRRRFKEADSGSLGPTKPHNLKYIIEETDEFLLRNYVIDQGSVERSAVKRWPHVWDLLKRRYFIDVECWWTAECST